MKKIVLILLCTLVLTGCTEDKKDVEEKSTTTTTTTETTTTSTTTTTKAFKLSKGRYVNKKSSFNGGYLDSMTIGSKNKISSTHAAPNAGGITQEGTYKIKNNKLSYKMTFRWDLAPEVDGEKIKNAKTEVCEIVKDNTFKCDNTTYVLEK